MIPTEQTKILIVDDDQLVLNDLLNLIDWEKEGFEIVGTAANGKLAFDMFRLTHPKIVITDIIMPIMDGIELIQKIKELNENTEFLVLSSYDEFNYAKSAMRLGVSDYLLKMELSSDYLIEKLNEISVKLKNEEKTLSLHQQLILQEFMKNQEIESPLFQLITQRKYHFYIIGWSDAYRYQTFNQHSQKTFSQSVLTSIAEILHLSNDDLIFSNYHFIMIGYFTEDFSTNIQLNKIKETMLKLADAVKIFYFSSRCSIKQFRSLYQTALPKCNYQLLFSTETFFPLATIHSADEQINAQTPHTAPVDLVLLFSKTSSEQDITTYLNNLYAVGKIPPLVSLFRYACTLINISEYNLDLFSSQDSFTAFILYAFHSYQTKQAEALSGYSVHVAKAIVFIESNYGDSTLSNSSIADSLEISGGRLSVLFKKETGKTLVEYITDYRIQRAIWLLLNSNKKIYEIATSVGYNSSQYFSQIFLHKTGKKPLDYRQSSITTIRIGES